MKRRVTITQFYIYNYPVKYIVQPTFHDLKLFPKISTDGAGLYIYITI